MNMAYTKEYLAWQKECQVVFGSAYRLPSKPEVKQKTLAHSWQLRSAFYQGKGVYAGEHELLDANHQVRYRWRNLNADGEFQQIIHHADEKDYLIFRQDLYGYSVLDLHTLADFHYIPRQAFPPEKAEFRETFIWTKVAYSPENNLLAVIGCFWACPVSVVLVEFTHPMIPNENWLDLHLMIDPGYDRYDDLEFVQWRADGALILKGINNETQATDTFILPESQLRRALTNPDLVV